jgi:ribosomal protein L37AE/L43A
MSLNKDRVCSTCHSKHDVKLFFTESGVNRWRCKECREKTKKFLKQKTTE